MTVQEILDTNTYVKDGSAISFKSPKDYIEPFIEKVSSVVDNFVVSTSQRVANIDQEDKSQESFARVLIEGYLPVSPELKAIGHEPVIGLVYGLDTQKPIIKVYAGNKTKACTNLCVFNADFIHEAELIKGTESIYKNAQLYAQNYAEMNEDFLRTYNLMNETEYVGTEIDRMIGALLRESIANRAIGNTCVVSAARELYDHKSKYSIKENTTSEWNMYSAVTQFVTDKVDIIDKASKTLLISNMFNKVRIN